MKDIFKSNFKVMLFSPLEPNKKSFKYNTTLFLCRAYC